VLASYDVADRLERAFEGVRLGERRADALEQDARVRALEDLDAARLEGAIVSPWYAPSSATNRVFFGAPKCCCACRRPSRRPRRR